jgi:hypothetical protein
METAIVEVGHCHDYELRWVLPWKVQAGILPVDPRERRDLLLRLFLRLRERVPFAGERPDLAGLAARR